MNFKKFCIMSLVILMLFCFTSFQVTAAQVTRTDQHATAYTSDAGDLTASGLQYQVGYVAVHPIYWGSDIPVLPFGTIIYILEVKDTNGNYISDGITPPGATDEMYAFQVQDIGDRDRILSEYFIDFYWGIKTPETEQSAINFGLKKVDYTYFN